MNQSSMTFRTAFGQVQSPPSPARTAEQCRALNINWIVDADVSGFFDELRHDLLREFIQRRSMMGDTAANRQMAERGGDGRRQTHLR